MMMKLYFSQTSPFVRLVRVVAAHHGLANDIDLVASGLFADETALRSANPLGKIPALVLPGGNTIYDSRVILEHLDRVGRGPRLLDPADPAIDRVRTRLALLTGILDAAVAFVMDSRRALPQMPDAWQMRQVTAIPNSVAAAAAQLDGADPLFRLCLPAVLDYLSFRLPFIDWQSEHADLAQFTAKALSGPHYAGTDPRLA